MTLEEYRRIAPALNAEIKQLVVKYGLSATKFSATIDATCGTISLKVDLADVNLKARDGSATTPKRERWTRYATFLGLNPTWLDRTFTSKGHVYTVAGLRESRGRNKVEIARDDGVTCTCAVADLVRHFERKAI